jgi:hypothetical protein
MKEWMKTLLGTALITAFCGSVFWLLGSAAKAETEEVSRRRDVACPSLLSIARSPRDTLIVMKNEPLCATFVLDSLK